MHDRMRKPIFDATYVHMYMQRHIIHTHVTCIHKTKVDIIYDQIHSKIIEFDVSMQIIPDLTKHKTIYCTVFTIFNNEYHYFLCWYLTLYCVINTPTVEYGWPSMHQFQNKLFLLIVLLLILYVI